MGWGSRNQVSISPENKIKQTKATEHWLSGLLQRRQWQAALSELSCLLLFPRGSFLTVTPTQRNSAGSLDLGDGSRCLGRTNGLEFHVQNAIPESRQLYWGTAWETPFSIWVGLPHLGEITQAKNPPKGQKGSLTFSCATKGAHSHHSHW